MRIITKIVLAILLITSATLTLGQAVPVAVPLTSTEKSATPPAPDASKYMLEYNLHEFEGSKQISTHAYKILITDHGQIRTGWRVPVTSASTNTSDPQTHMIDVGTTIDCDMKMSGGTLLLATTIDIRAVAPDPSGQGTSPVIRSNQAKSNVAVTFGKNLLIASIDDPLSPRRYLMEVKITQQ